jgi:hypothetical protein
MNVHGGRLQKENNGVSKRDVFETTLDIKRPGNIPGPTIINFVLVKAVPDQTVSQSLSTGSALLNQPPSGTNSW